MEYSALYNPLSAKQKLELFSNIQKGMYTKVDLSYSNFDAKDAAKLSTILSNLKQKPEIIIYGNPISLTGMTSLKAQGIPLANMCVVC